ncbi:MAG: ACT domain-containing protein [Candidatus Nanohaloarchaea archaeon]|nr:ACT domain-containing protein [Candidatus Nanohaloarchaea archaeon]
MSVADEVVDYVEQRPYIQEALEQGIVNFAALARQVGEEVDGSFEAIKVALRRYAEQREKERQERRAKITDVLSDTSIQIRSNVTVYKNQDGCDATLHARTEHGYTNIVIGDGDCSGERIEDQVLVSLESPTSLEDTPGVLAFVLSILAGRGINVTELISCREDTHIVIHEDDATEAFKLLNEKLS